jgi:hypothetical protein
MALIDTFRKQASRTWMTLLRSRKFGIHYGEEGLTDANLLEIGARHPKEVRTRKFKKHEESRFGADWEWWFVGKSGYLGFRVQAKVIDLESGVFEHLHYRRGKKGVYSYQSDTLIDDAFLYRPQRIPLYCLYSNWDTSGNQYRYSWNCRKYNRSVRSYGCAIVSALAVKANRLKKKRDLNSLLPHMHPWHCLLCNCNATSSKQDLPQRVYSFWKNTICPGELELLRSYNPEQIGQILGDRGGLYDANPETVLPGFYDAIGITTKPPDYVLNFMFEDRISPNVEDELVASGLHSITIFSERNTGERYL